MCDSHHVDSIRGFGDVKDKEEKEGAKGNGDAQGQDKQQQWYVGGAGQGGRYTFLVLGLVLPCALSLLVSAALPFLSSHCPCT